MSGLEPFNARWHDGLTAAVRTVEVKATGEGLAFIAEDGLRILAWPGLRALDAARGRLAHDDMPDARLDVPVELLPKLARMAPHLAPRPWLRREGRLVAALAAGGALVAALVYFGIPAAARPLAMATPVAYEAQLGESIALQLDLPLDTCEDGEIDTAGLADLRRVADRLAAHADLRFPIEVRVVDLPAVNALALPGGKVWIMRGLIDKAGGPDEVAAVIAHEIAHVERRDVMAALYRSMGYGLVLDAFVGGGSGAGQQLILVSGVLADNGHSRETEAAADARAIGLMHAAGLDSRGLAAFFGRMAAEDGDAVGGKWLEMVSTHPDSVKRRDAARQQARAGAPAMDAAAWSRVRAICGADRTDPE